MYSEISGYIRKVNDIFYLKILRIHNIINLKYLGKILLKISGYIRKYAVINLLKLIVNRQNTLANIYVYS